MPWRKIYSNSLYSPYPKAKYVRSAISGNPSLSFLRVDMSEAAPRVAVIVPIRQRSKGLVTERDTERLNEINRSEIKYVSGPKTTLNASDVIITCITRPTKNPDKSGANNTI